LLHLTSGHDGAPVLPNVLLVDIAGGAWSAVMNILLALRAGDAEGQGCRLDIAVADHLFTLAWWGLGDGHAAGQWPRPASGFFTGA
jgi:crotonobetainyl-CoA:carnitine CoA-transferase CaiB-like acyl-CoA transferase